MKRCKQQFKISPDGVYLRVSACANPASLAKIKYNSKPIRTKDKKTTIVLQEAKINMFGLLKMDLLTSFSMRRMMILWL